MMKSWTRRFSCVAAVGVLAALPAPAFAGRLDVQPENRSQSTGASSGGFFSGLFGGRSRYAPLQVYVPDTAPAPRSKGGGPSIKIQSPEYYDFKAEPLAPVNFAPLMTLARSASIDMAVGATQFRESLTGLDGFELISEKPIADAIVAYYTANPGFVWFTDGAPNERARAAAAVLSDAGSYGLDPNDYRMPAPPAPLDPDAGQEARDALIRYEMTLSARVLRYLRDARGGRLDPNQLSGYHDLPVKPFDGKAELARMARAGDTRLAMEAAHPQMPEYAALRTELAALQGTPREVITVDPDLLLNPGGSSPELANVMKLIARDLPADRQDDAAAIAAFGGGSDYVPELVSVVKAAQERAGLRADGVIGPRTIKALTGVTGDKTERVEKVKLALEQLRWLPRMLGETRVFINEPAFTVSYMEDGAEKLSMRAVVGKATNQTSYFYDEIEQVDYNPYWGVPQSILVNEMLPRLRRDPGYLDRAGYEVTNAKGKKVSSSSVNWGAYGSKIPFNVRQTPSEANALGELKILFPNKHAIYMHDTPQKALFKKDMRAFSHGCVRLEHPREMAAAVLGKPVDYVAEKLGEGHSVEKVDRHIPVYVAYFTAWPDAAGKVGYFADVYERDAHLEEALEKVRDARQPGV